MTAAISGILYMMGLSIALRGEFRAHRRLARMAWQLRAPKVTP